jgi:ADP-dependent phosphofructokinase/glucokinase
MVARHICGGNKFVDSNQNIDLSKISELLGDYDEQEVKRAIEYYKSKGVSCVYEYVRILKPNVRFWCDLNLTKRKILKQLAEKYRLSDLYLQY